MSPSRSPRRARPADRKQQLVDHAATLFAERGYAQVSLADIARAAGVTAPSVYRHFADKHALLAAAVMGGVDELESCTDRVLADDTATLDDLISTVCALGVRNPASTSLWRSASQHLRDDENREVVLRIRGVVHRWAGVLATTTAIPERDAVEVCWATLSIVGSLGVHSTRLSTARALASIESLVHQLITLRPDTAPPLAAPPSMGIGERTRRDEILDAAADLFARRGYTGVGVDDIGAAVGITGPSVYRHFSSKLAILLGIGQRSATRLEAGAMAAYGTTSDPAKILALLVDSYVGVITSSPDLSVAFNNSAVLAGQSSANDLLDVQRRYVARWVELMTQTHPDIPREQATVAVHAALSIVNDAVRVRRGTSRPEFPGRMAYLTKGVLGI
ncbi:TetR/AcrR family transcriptional regulator [Gordonia sp. VNQ95]|jgi:AcrR family transcriptional regulator|uniref:TetR/AcrR family transcriptional regulator n=1 Tax=Gordonia TaxID=2053 RepID=UPI0032B5BABE